MREEPLNTPSNNLVSFPLGKPMLPPIVTDAKSEAIKSRARKLGEISAYKSEFDFDIYRQLEKRFELKNPRGGIVFNSPFKLVNSHHTCQQCLYSFEIDTYGRGCLHDCVYCYAKAELTVHGYWNRPFPMPADMSNIWKTFYTVFETDKDSKWRSVMEKRTPLRIGSMSDSFMFMDQKYGVTKELLKILDFYKYPYVIFTRSDLVAHDDYIPLMDPKLCSIQMSISSLNDTLNRKIEAGAPSSTRRLLALQKLNEAGFWTTARLNPFFPIYADGYFTDPDFDKKNMPEPFEYSSFEMIDEMASYGVNSVLAGMVRLSAYSLTQIEKAIGRDLHSFYKKTERKNAIFSEKTNMKSRDFHYSGAETRAYYEKLKEKCIANAMEFSTCYIGNGDEQFWRDQDLWSNKSDCCNVKGKVESFTTDSRQIPWRDRLQHRSGANLSTPEPHSLHLPLGDRSTVKTEINKIPDMDL